MKKYTKLKTEFETAKTKYEDLEKQVVQDAKYEHAKKIVAAKTDKEAK